VAREEISLPSMTVYFLHFNNPGNTKLFALKAGAKTGDKD
jgi:hypothetical protein